MSATTFDNQQQPTGEWIPLALSERLSPGQVAVVDVQGEPVILYCSGSDLHAYPDRCTHEAFPLSTGHVFQGSIVCRMHGAKFDLKTGACLRSPGCDLTPYQVALKDGTIFVNRTPEADAGVNTRSRRGHLLSAPGRGM